MKKDLVSVLITSYNYARYLGSAIDSILAQTYPEWELVIVDDASSDDSQALIERYRRRYPDRIQAVLLEKNGGQSAATNIGLNHAKGEFVALLGSDDVARPERLAQGVRLLRQRQELAGAFSRTAYIDAEGRSIPEASIKFAFDRNFSDLRWELLHGNFLCAPSAILRTEALRETGGFNRHLGYTEDYDLWMRLLDRHELVRSDEIWVDYRIHGNNLSISSTGKQQLFAPAYELVTIAIRAMHRWPLTKLAHFKSRPGTRGFQKESAVVQTRLAEACLHLETCYFQQVAALNLPSPKIAVAAAYHFVLEALQNDPENSAAQDLLPTIYAALGDTPRARGDKSITLEAMQQTQIDTLSQEKERENLPECEVKPAKTIPSYPEWLGTLGLSKVDAHHYDQLIEQGRLTTHFHLVAALVPGDEALLGQTIASLSAQLHHNITLSVVSSIAPPNGFEGKRLRWRQVAPESLLAGANQALLEEDTHWIGLLRLGDTLSPETLLMAAEAIERHPEWKVVYTDDDLLDVHGHLHSPRIKPEFDLTLARSTPYVSGLVLARWDEYALVQGFDPELADWAEYDLLLKIAERNGTAAVGHLAIPRLHRMDTRSSPPETHVRALEKHLTRTQTAADLFPHSYPESVQLSYPLPRQALVSIIIPTRDRLPMLSRAVESLLEKTNYPAFELLIVDHASTTPATRDFLSGISAMNNPKLRVLYAPSAESLAGLFNLGAKEARGELLLLLHDDVAALQPDWLDRMIAQIERPGIGAVGARLISTEGRLQHAGIALGLSGCAEILGEGASLDEPGYLGRYLLDQEVSAVSAACLLVRRNLYRSLNGFDQTNYPYFLPDVDFCLRLTRADWRIVWTPQATLLHDGPRRLSEGIRATPLSAKERAVSWLREQERLVESWRPQLAEDPHYPRAYNLNLPAFRKCEDTFLARNVLPWHPVPVVLAQPSDREACGHYRISSPLLALAREGLVQGWDSLSFYSPIEIERLHPDVFVFQRPYTDLQFAHIQRCKKHSQGLRLFDMDDLMTRIPQASLNSSSFPVDLEARLKRAAALCDRLVVSTVPLAHAFRSWHNDIRIVPNRLPKSAWLGLRPARRCGAKPRVGWAGAIGHEGDLAMITEVIAALADEVEWVLLGKCPEVISQYLHEHRPQVPLSDYPAALAKMALDVAIAPLEINPFNEAKSALKLLEYGVLGYPVVCTDITPYQGGFPVTRVRNRSSDWVKAIRALAHDPERCAAEGDQLREHIVTHWMLEDKLDEWFSAWAR